MVALVTGASGFVGSHVARQLLERGDRVKLLVRPTSSPVNLAQLTGADVCVGDLGDSASLRAALTGCDVLYHVAADYRLWSRRPADLYRANVEGTRNILTACAQSGVRRVVYTSTVGVLGVPPDGSPGTEETPVSLQQMVGHYKRSKFLAEQVAREYVSRGLDVVIVNPSTPVGENDVKPTPTGRIIVDFLRGKLPAYVDTGLNLVDVRDAAAGMLLAAERGCPGRRYILGCRNTTLCEMLQMLAVAANRPAPRVRLPYALAWTAVGLENLVVGGLLRREPAHPFEGVRMARHRMFFDSSLAVRELGMPQSPVEEALSRAAAWFRSQGYAPAS